MKDMNGNPKYLLPVIIIALLVGIVILALMLESLFGPTTV